MCMMASGIHTNLTSVENVSTHISSTMGCNPSCMVLSPYRLALGKLLWTSSLMGD